MTQSSDFEIFLVTSPGLEQVLADEARAHGFDDAQAVPGGVTIRGGWPEVWRANLELRGAGRVLVRIGQFMVFHLAQLDKRARRFPWGDVLRADVPVRVEVTCKASKVYHAGAATQRIETALREELGVTIAPDAEVVIKARIDNNQVTISVDSSGESLHKRGHKPAVGKAPMRENLAALFLRECGYDGRAPVVDPMCGSGTFVIEAAEIAAGMQPGRSRTFAFEKLATFDAGAFAALRRPAPLSLPAVRFHGFDRDAGAIKMSIENAERAGVDGFCDFQTGAISDLTPPAGAPGLVMVNPPYGARIGDKKQLYALYGSLGKILLSQFSGWRVGIVTSEPSLAKATGLPFVPTGAPVAFGGLKVRLYRTEALA